MFKPVVSGLCCAFAASVVLLLVGAAHSQQKGKAKGKEKDIESKFEKGKDQLPGKARWEWVLFDGKKEEDRGTFMAYTNGTVFMAKNQVGTWKSTGKKAVEVQFTAGKLKGKATLHRTKASEPTYEGKLRQKGAERRLRVEIVND